MSIQYYLRENTLPTAAGTYSIHFAKNNSIDFEGIAKELATQSTTVSEPDIQAVLTALTIQLRKYILEGYRVNVGDLFQLYPKFSGSMNSESDTFDPAIHSITVGGRATYSMKKDIARDAVLQKVLSPVTVGRLFDYIDTASGTTNTTITAGRTGKLKGAALSFDKAAPDEGLYLIDSIDDAESIEPVECSDTDPSVINMLWPATLLSSGEGYLALKTRQGKPLGRIQTFILNKTLTQVT